MKASLLRRLERLETAGQVDHGVDAARARDPVRLMTDLDMTPDPWQREVLNSTSNRIIIMSSRQAGKSTVASLKALHPALYRPGSLVLCLAPVQRQSSELFEKVLYVYHMLNRPVPALRETRTTLELMNRSRIVCLPGKASTVRSFSAARLIIVDEAAQVSDDGLFAAIMPMLAVSQGAFMACSTPYGRRGWYHEVFTGNEPGWMRVVAPSASCPRIDPTFVAEQSRLLGDRWAQQEFQCVFLDAIGQCFSTNSIEAAFDPNVRVLDGF
jgi:hypothetical protein